MAGRTAFLVLDGEIGRGYRIQASSDLSATNSVELLTITNTTEATPLADTQADPQVRL